MAKALGKVNKPSGGLHVKKGVKLGFSEMKSGKGKSIRLGSNNTGSSVLNAMTKGNM